MIDIHTHLLPGVDDGSPSIDVSVPVLERFRDHGVERLVCTPHLRASDASRVAPNQYAEVFAALVEHAPSRPALALGREIMLDVPGADLRGVHLRLGDSSAVLVEFPRMGVPPGADRELLRLRMSGVVPVLAHPERYRGCTPDKVEEWRNVGAVIQMDAAMIFGNAPMCRMARMLLEAGLVDCIASDNHGDGRSLNVARAWLMEVGAEEQAELLTSTNAAHLLANEPLVAVAPIPRVESGMLRRLRGLLFGRR
ncbi:MAG TPA: CpsB/CapC family capsule biosynthesis tyrosine phosphatase [Gemmatimonadaceae bacterium]|nr:CpsB/CapC family capsule biosynthesis tyrosine phosphatase [Gemmatimonadaceae bacterium]